jgi:hypothetical protein
MSKRHMAFGMVPDAWWTRLIYSKHCRLLITFREALTNVTPGSVNVY